MLQNLFILLGDVIEGWICFELESFFTMSLSQVRRVFVQPFVISYIWF